MKRGLLLFSLFSIFFLIYSASCIVYINEVMPHSNNTWKDEWLELYNPENLTLNLSNWKISDLSSTDNFSLIIPAFSYALIVDSSTSKDNLTGCNTFNISNESCFELTTIGSGLNDNNETIFLFDNLNNSIDNFSWHENIKSSGKSWSLNSSNNLKWLKCSPSPGFFNSCSEYQNNQNETEENNQTNNNEEDPESRIKITDSPNKAKFGEEIDIDLEIYKGSTNKYALYVYVQNEDKNKVSKKITLHLRTKYTDYDEQVSLELDCLDESGDYKIIAEGLDDKDTESIYLESCSKFAKTLSSTNNLQENNLPQSNQALTPNNPSPKTQNQNNLITGSSVSSNKDFPNFLIILPVILSFITLLIIISLILKKVP